MTLIENKINMKDTNEALSKTAKIFKDFYNENYKKVIESIEKNKYFYDLKDQALINRIPQGLKVLDIGCGKGDLLSKLKPSFGVGVDLSENLIKIASESYKNENLKFIEGDVFSNDVLNQIGDEKFDVILLINTVTQVHDVIELMKLIHRFCHSKTRVYVYSYSRLWQPLFYLANLFGMRVKPPEESWLPPEELTQMFYLSDFQAIKKHQYILFPFQASFFSDFINDYLAHMPILENLSMFTGFVLRPIGEKYKNEILQKPTCSIVIPCRNEAGHIYEIINRLPELNPGSEYIFVEGNSTDNTEEVVKAAISENPDKPFKFFKQEGVGKGDAVRKGFSEAKGDILAILDADITVCPTDLPRFIEVLTSNKAEFVNGSRLVYPMEKKAMKFLNLLANKFFALAFSYLLGQQIRDTLCGTKVLWKKDYQEILNNRSYFGDFDPFGDFDLIFGASKLNLKIVDLPVRYGERTYGDTNISRFRHGLLLLRMTLFAFKKIKMV